MLIHLEKGQDVEDTSHVFIFFSRFILFIMFLGFAGQKSTNINQNFDRIVLICVDVRPNPRLGGALEHQSYFCISWLSNRPS